MLIKPTSILGCFHIKPMVRKDGRGFLVKTYQQELFEENNLQTKYVEDYYSYSRKGVLRGLHFQIPPFHHVKLVSCTQGVVMDVVLDLRVGSPTYGSYEVFELSGMDGDMLYLPEGIGHGFLALTDSVIIHYKTTRKYSAEYDMGIRWDSLGVQWPISNPVLSERDLHFPRLDEFISPFNYCSGNSTTND